MKRNISLLFYKNYFQEIKFTHLFERGANIRDEIRDNTNSIKEVNKKITEQSDLEIIPNIKTKHRIHATIQYPGLITGVGINHEAKIEGEFKLGINFDYTYGMPVIHGSSVKGLLRSAFPDSKSTIERENDPIKKKKREKIRESKVKLISQYLNSIENKSIDIDSLRDHIFDGIGKDKNIESIYRRDIFFDAVIIKPVKRNILLNGIEKTVTRILDSDSITPHIHKNLTYEQSMLKNPIPLIFLKIASGVKMEFRFNLKDGLISAKEKRDLFAKILEDFGIGAKTNVGYGQFSKIEVIEKGE